MITKEQFIAIKKHYGFTDVQLAKLLGVSERSIRRYKKGDRSISQNIEKHLYRILADMEAGE